MTATRRSELIDGFKSMVPISIGSIPYGLLYGALVSDLKLPLFFEVGMSPIIFGASAQFTALELLITDTSFLIIVMTTFIVNLRYLFYGASLSPYMKELPMKWRMILAFLLTDPVFILSITNYRERDWSNDENKYFHWYYFGAGIISWIWWIIISIMGILIVGNIPHSIPIDFMLPLIFIALLVPSLKDTPSVLSGLLSGMFMIIFLNLPYKLGLIITVLLGVVTGLILEQCLRK
jgi:4-azaleucine resistance transporter AzlC